MITKLVKKQVLSRPPVSRTGICWFCQLEKLILVYAVRWGGAAPHRAQEFKKSDGATPHRAQEPDPALNRTQHFYLKE